MSREDQRARGETARRIMSEPMLVEAFETLEAKVMEQLIAAPSFSLFGDRKRARLIDRIRAIREVRLFLETEMSLGAQASRDRPPRP